MSNEFKRMQKLAGTPVNEEKENLNEVHVNLNEVYVAGGIVGVGAINQPKREKTDYEMAFEHFMTEGEEKVEEASCGSYEEDDTTMEEGMYEEDDTMEEAVGIPASAEAITGIIQKMMKDHSNDADLGAAIRKKFAK